MRLENLKIHNIFWEKYKFFYIFNSLIKFFVFLYFIYFFIIFLDFGFLSGLQTNCFESTDDEFAKAIEPIYIILLLIISTTLVGFVIDLFIMFTKKDQFFLSRGQHL